MEGLQTYDTVPSFFRVLGIQTPLSVCRLSHLPTQSACGVVTLSLHFLGSVTKLHACSGQSCGWVSAATTRPPLLNYSRAGPIQVEEFSVCLQDPQIQPRRQVALALKGKPRYSHSVLPQSHGKVFSLYLLVPHYSMNPSSLGSVTHERGLPSSLQSWTCCLGIHILHL